jgi:hypothetical protein
MEQLSDFHSTPDRKRVSSTSYGEKCNKKPASQTDLQGVQAAFKSPKRKSENDDDDAPMEHFVCTKEGKAAVMKSPALQKLVMGSPRLKRALFKSSSKKSSNGN